MSKLCSNCNAENIDEAKFCRSCGTQFEIKKENYSSNIFDESIKKTYTKLDVFFNPTYYTDKEKQDILGYEEYKEYKIEQLKKQLKKKKI